MLVIFRPYLLAYLAFERSEQGEQESGEAVQWLMIGYIRHLENQTDPHTLLEVLRQPSRISEGAGFLGRVLREVSEPDASLIEAGLRFWDEALSMPRLQAEALQGFGWWAEGSAIDDEAWLDRIYPTLQLTRGRIDQEDEVVQRLIRLSDHPSAWRSLSLIVKGTSDRWAISYWARNLHDLFKRTQNSGETIRRLRAELIERLLERELLDFRQYLR